MQRLRPPGTWRRGSSGSRLDGKRRMTKCTSDSSSDYCLGNVCGQYSYVPEVRFFGLNKRMREVASAFGSSGSAAALAAADAFLIAVHWFAAEAEASALLRVLARRAAARGADTPPATPQPSDGRYRSHTAVPFR